MVEALHLGGIPSALVRGIRVKYPDIPEAEIEDIVSSSMASLFDEVDAGKEITNLWSWLFKVADRRAVDYLRMRAFERLANEEVLDGNHPPLFAEASRLPLEAMPDFQRQWALEKAHALLPRLGGENIQRVMAVVLEAIENGVEDLSYRDIGDTLGLKPDTVKTQVFRGFERLGRLAREEGLLGEAEALATSMQSFGLRGEEADSDDLFDWRG